MVSAVLAREIKSSGFSTDKSYTGDCILLRRGLPSHLLADMKKCTDQKWGGQQRDIHRHMPFILSTRHYEPSPSPACFHLILKTTPQKQVCSSHRTKMQRGWVNCQRPPTRAWWGRESNPRLSHSKAHIFLFIIKPKNHKEHHRTTQSWSITSLQGLQGFPPHLLPSPVKCIAGRTAKMQTPLSSAGFH